MSGPGGPPHHPHNRPLTAGNTAWNHLQVPNFYPRQPQHAHMSNEHPILHQPTWHTPTTEPLKLQHSHIINLEQMLSERPFLQQPSAPISLSVRDTNKINSLAASALERQIELKPANPPAKTTTTTTTTTVAAASPAKSASPSRPAACEPPPQQLSPKMRKVRRVDSILERLTPHVHDADAEKAPAAAAAGVQSVHDENSNASSILNVPTPREDDVVSPYSNEDSRDSNKSRRKRKPARTKKVAKDVDAGARLADADALDAGVHVPAADAIDRLRGGCASQRHQSASPTTTPRKARRKASSEDETIDKIAAMVGTIAQKEVAPVADAPAAEAATCAPTIVTPAQKKDFVAVEDKLEEMFAGLDDSQQANIGAPPTAARNRKKPARRKRKPKGAPGADGKRSRAAPKTNAGAKRPRAARKVNGKTQLESVKDVYAYDSGSNASSGKSRGPFVHVSGPRDSPLSAYVVNTPLHSDDDARKCQTARRPHDDAVFRSRMRQQAAKQTRTLPAKHDAQARDASWICAFCKRGPYTRDFSSETARFSPGELFGPYAIAHAHHLDDPFERAFKSKKVARALEGRRAAKRLADTLQDCRLGIALMDDCSYEVWAHEDCMVWAPGLCLIGPKVVGLAEAVWSASNVACARCAMKGANVCCLRRGCTNVVHVGCAHLAHWQLDDDKYKAFCAEHKAPL